MPIAKYIQKSIIDKIKELSWKTRPDLSDERKEELFKKAVEFSCKDIMGVSFSELSNLYKCNHSLLCFPTKDIRLYVVRAGDTPVWIVNGRYSLPKDSDIYKEIIEFFLKQEAWNKKIENTVSKVSILISEFDISVNKLLDFFPEIRSVCPPEIKNKVIKRRPYLKKPRLSEGELEELRVVFATFKFLE